MSVKELMNFYAFDGIQAQQTKEALEDNYADELAIEKMALYVDKCECLNILYSFVHKHNERYPG